MRGSPLKDFPSDLLRSLVSLKVMHADNYKLCCEAMLPEDFDLNNCHVEKYLLASCKDLLKFNVYLVFLWLFASLSVVGNVGSFVARLLRQQRRRSVKFQHLCHQSVHGGFRHGGLPGHCRGG